MSCWVNTAKSGRAHHRLKVVFPSAVQCSPASRLTALCFGMEAPRPEQAQDALLIARLHWNVEHLRGLSSPFHARR